MASPYSCALARCCRVRGESSLVVTQALCQPVSPGGSQGLGDLLMVSSSVVGWVLGLVLGVFLGFFFKGCLYSTVIHRTWVTSQRYDSYQEHLNDRSVFCC